MPMRPDPFFGAGTYNSTISAVPEKKKRSGHTRLKIITTNTTGLILIWHVIHHFTYNAKVYGSECNPARMGICYFAPTVNIN